MPYKVTAIVERADLSTVMEALGKCRVEPDIEKIKSESHGAVERSRTYGAISGTPGGKAVLTAMNNGAIFTSEELNAALSGIGLKRSSVSSITSGLVREGKVAKIGRGRFQIATRHDGEARP